MDIAFSIAPWMVTVGKVILWIVLGGLAVLGVAFIWFLWGLKLW